MLSYCELPDKKFIYFKVVSITGELKIQNRQLLKRVMFWEISHVTKLTPSKCIPINTPKHFNYMVNGKY